MFLRYNELRALIGDAGSLDARDARRRERRDAREAAFAIRPPRLGRHGHGGRARVPVPDALGLPGEVPPAAPPTSTEQIVGLAASPGVVEGPARVVESLEQFDQVQAGDVLVCKMTNPAWVVLFTKIAASSPTPAAWRRTRPSSPASSALPAVVGTSNATQRDQDGRARARQRRHRRRGRSSGEQGRDDRPSGLRDRVKDVLLERIASRRTTRPASASWRPAIAQELGVSQAPVREALRDLEQLGLVVHERIPRLHRAARLGRGAARGLPGAGRARGARRAPRRGADRRTSTSHAWSAARGDGRRGARRATRSPRRTPTRASTPRSWPRPATRRSSGSGRCSSRSPART